MPPADVDTLKHEKNRVADQRDENAPFVGGDFAVEIGEQAQNDDDGDANWNFVRRYDRKIIPPAAFFDLAKEVGVVGLGNVLERISNRLKVESSWNWAIAVWTHVKPKQHP